MSRIKLTNGTWYHISGMTEDEVRKNFEELRRTNLMHHTDKIESIMLDEIKKQ